MKWESLWKYSDVFCIFLYIVLECSWHEIQHSRLWRMWKYVEFVFKFSKMFQVSESKHVVSPDLDPPILEEVCCFPSSGRLVRYGCRGWLRKFGECAVHCQGGKMGKIWRSRFILVSQKWIHTGWFWNIKIFLNHPKSVVHVFDVDLDSFG